jgi:hypothetical protein
LDNGGSEIRGVSSGDWTSSASVSEEVGKEEEADEAGPRDSSTRVTTRAVRNKEMGRIQGIEPMRHSFSLFFFSSFLYSQIQI